MPDTVTVNTVDSVAVPEAPYEALHAEHFEQLLAADSANVATIDSVSADSTMATMTVPSTPAPSPLPPSPLESNVVVGLMVAAVFFAVASYRVGYKYFDNIFHNIFSTRRRENLFEDHTFNETQILAALIALTCVCQGVIAYVNIGLPRGASAALFVPVLCGVSLLFYLLQLGVYAVLGYIFLDEIDRKLWLDGYKSTQSLLGVTLVPIAVTLLVLPQHGMLLTGVAIVLFFLARLLFIFKGMRIFLVNFSSLVPFILYLCAAEIAPVIAISRATLVLCDFLQT